MYAELGMGPAVMLMKYTPRQVVSYPRTTTALVNEHRKEEVGLRHEASCRHAAQGIGIGIGNFIVGRNT
jgi:hypothetical protein